MTSISLTQTMKYALLAVPFSVAFALPHQAFSADIVNPQITDSVTQANTEVLGDAPAIATGNLMIATSQALSNAAHNATSAQQNSNTILQATTTQGVSLDNVDRTSSGAAER